jgi:mannose-6-phosphate isomerase-like protein (cupin superfamily)
LPSREKEDELTMGGRYEPERAAWKQVGHEAAQAVESQVIVPLEEGGRTQVAVTRIAAGGEYGTHVDDYSQVFCVVEGRGEGEVAGERTPLEPGVMLRTAAGEPHALRAGGDEALVVLTVNTYPAG